MNIDLTTNFKKHFGIILTVVLTFVIVFPLIWLFVIASKSGDSGEVITLTVLNYLIIGIFSIGLAAGTGYLYNKYRYKFFLYTFLSILALFILFPFYWMIITSLKSYDEVILPFPTMVPNYLMFSNFKVALEEFRYFDYVFNTLFVAGISTVLTLVTTVLSAFAFARLKFKGSGFLFALLLSTMMIPGEMYVITNYITVARLDWLDSYQVLIVPFIVSMFYVFLLRQSFKQIPDSLYWAAKVDGTSDFKYLRRVMVPIAMPSIITITILKIIGTWNAYVWPNLVTNDDNYYLISNGLRNTVFGDGTDIIPHIELEMAASLLVSLPLLIAFALFKKYIMRGVGNAGVKG